MPLLHKFQARYMCAVHSVGENACNGRIGSWLHATFGTEVNIGKLSRTAEELLSLGFINIVETNKKGRVILEVTDTGFRAIEETLKTVRQAEKEKSIFEEVRRRKKLH